MLIAHGRGMRLSGMSTKLLHGTSSSSAKDRTEQGNFKSTFRFIYKLQLDIATTMGSGIYHNLEYESSSKKELGR